MDSKIVLEMAPTKENPRNSEGDFIKLKDGRIMYAYSKFVGGCADWSTTEIAAVFSNDNGDHWSDPKVFFKTSDFENCENIMSVSLMRMNDGAVGMFFLIRRNSFDMRLHLFRSYDEGETWSEPICCIPRKGYFVTNNNRVIRTSTGRLIFPGNYLFIRDESNPYSFSFHETCHYFYSDDDGETWQESPNFSSMPFSCSISGLEETGLIELRPGLIMAYSRTDLCMQFATYSHDDGISWTPVEPLRFFTSAVSPMKIQRLTDNRLISFWNPTPMYTCRDCTWDTARSPFAYAFSTDNGNTWLNPTIFENDPNSGYSYPAVYCDDGFILVAYCAGSKEDGSNLNRLRIRKFIL